MLFPNYTHNFIIKRESDPINLIFYNTSCKQVVDELKWDGNTFWWSHSIKINGKWAHQTAQKVDGPIQNRDHLRIWKYGTNQCLANAHHEVIRFFKHHVTSHETAEKKIAEHFEKSGWEVDRDSLDLKNYQEKHFNNGLATEIKR